MKKQQHSLEYIKRLATKLKKERNIKHTEALAIVAKDLGYSNWAHCQRSLHKPPHFEVKTAATQFHLTFTDWLKKQKNRNSPLGDLSSDMLRDDEWPSYNTVEEYKGYLNSKNAYYGAVSALERAWKTYEAYLKKKQLPDSSKPQTKKPAVKKHDPRKIVYVKNVTPLPHTKRTVEKFNPGDAAWISWDGRKAIPVTINEVDDTHYSFRIERPLWKAGNKHFLFLDEVRSTPKLACVNHVTL